MKKIIIIFFFFSIIVSSCAQPKQLTQPVDQTLTIVAQTQIIEEAIQNGIIQTLQIEHAIQTGIAQTQAAAASNTPSTTNTPIPTDTPAPTLTPTVSVTPYLSPTPTLKPEITIRIDNYCDYPVWFRMVGPVDVKLIAEAGKVAERQVPRGEYTFTWSEDDDEWSKYLDVHVWYAEFCPENK